MSSIGASHPYYWDLIKVYNFIRKLFTRGLVCSSCVYTCQVSFYFLMNYKEIIDDSSDHRLPSTWRRKVVQNVTQVDAIVG